VTLKSRIIIGLLAVLAVLAVSSAIYSWYRTPPAIFTDRYVSVPQIKTVTKLKTVEVPVEKIVVIEKQVVVEKLKLPDWVKTDAGQQVLTTAEIPPYEGITNAVAVMNTQSGTSQIVAKQVPLPLFAFEAKREVGVRGGVATAAESNIDITIYGRWDFLRIGNTHIGAYVEGDSSGSAKAQVQVGYKW